MDLPGFDGGFAVPGLKERLLDLYNRTQPNAAVFNGCGKATIGVPRQATLVVS